MRIYLNALRIHSLPSNSFNNGFKSVVESMVITLEFVTYDFVSSFVHTSYKSLKH